MIPIKTGDSHESMGKIQSTWQSDKAAETTDQPGSCLQRQIFCSNLIPSCSPGSCLPLLAEAPPAQTQRRLHVQPAWDYKAISVFCHVSGAFSRWKVGESQTKCPLTVEREVATSFAPSSWQLCS